MDDSVLQTVPLGTPPWPTVDPFLFCVHHDDHYPAANAELGPDEPLTGRSIGNDFAGTDGWNMYHGSVVPGFPQHPHRGFETVTFARDGIIDHADSLGATARFGRGDVQWMTAGAGVVHSEMFPLLNSDAPNHLELFQIWLNLPAADKFVDPYFTMLWSEQIPTIVADGVTVTVLAGQIDGHVPPPPPPNSWAARPEAELAIWHIVLDPGAAWTMPTASPEAARTLYLFAGGGAAVASQAVPTKTGVAVDASHEVAIVADDQRVEILLLQGRPIGEPVAQYGPFVMNTEAEIQETFRDYRETGFGGWPWPADDPHHGADAGRFAKHANGLIEHA